MLPEKPITSWAALKAKLAITDSIFLTPVNIQSGVICEALSLGHITFKRDFSITESEFSGDVDFSFCTFEQGIDLTGSIIKGKANFRAAHVKGDLAIPLTSFEGPACFDDIHIDEVLNAEGCCFEKEADFNRLCVSKSAIFCCALLSGDKALQTKFKGEANFNDSHFQGPLYFSGAHFYNKVYFNRTHANSAAFFNCDLLEQETEPSQPKHREYTLTKRELGKAKRDLFVTCFEDTVSFVGAKIGGSISFSGAQFGNKSDSANTPTTNSEAKADFRRIQIDGTALFDPLGYSDSFKRIIPIKDIFKRVIFNYDAFFWNANIKGAARFEAVYFGREANFEHVQIGRRAYFNPVEYKGELVCAEFIGKASFRDADIKGTVAFMSAQFGNDADFERLTTDGSMYFRPFVDEKLTPETIRLEKFKPVRFERSVLFVGCRVRGNAEFDSAEFANNNPKEEKDDENDFSRIEVGGNIYFRRWSPKDSEVKFTKKVWFIGAHIKGSAKFSGTEFKDDADFSNLRVDGDAYFDCSSGDEEKDNSKEARPPEPVRFQGAAKFNGATFLSIVSFKRVCFEKEADFTGARCYGEVTFKEAKFKSDAVFREARFTSLVFDRVPSREIGWVKYLYNFMRYLFSRRWRQAYSRFNRRQIYLKSLGADTRLKKQFGGEVDLIGCTYDRIGVELKHLLECMQQKSRNREYNRQPYTQMSKTLLANGYDRRAEWVYVEQRKRERNATWHRLKRDVRNGLVYRSFLSSANLLLDLFLYVIAKYGVQIERLVFISVAIILIGSGIFCIEGAVQPRTPIVKATIKRDTAQTATTQNAEEPPLIFETAIPSEEEKNLEWPEALGVSISQFLPVVDIPSGSKWKPSQQSFFDIYGSIHRVSGAILVPLLLAALAATLYRRFKSSP